MTKKNNDFSEQYESKTIQMLLEPLLKIISSCKNASFVIPFEVSTN